MIHYYLSYMSAKKRKIEKNVKLLLQVTASAQETLDLLQNRTIPMKLELLILQIQQIILHFNMFLNYIVK